MGILFGRDCTDTFYLAAIELLKTSPDPGCRALATNLEHDSRVCEERQRAFDKYLEAYKESGHIPGNPGDRLLKGLKDYKYEHVQATPNPDFLNRSLNLENIQRAGELLENNHADENLRLARIINLNGLGILYQWAKEQGHRFERIELSRYKALGANPFEASVGAAVASPDITQRWLSDELDGMTSNEQLVFVREICQLLSSYRNDVGVYQPYWATLWTDLQPHVSKGPDCWSQLMGVDHGGESGQWVLLLVYPYDPMVTYARPTQLDAGGYPRHYPSPLNFGGGHPMRLSPCGSNGTLLTELIHSQIDHTESHFSEGNSKIAFTSQVFSCHLIPTERQSHHSMLAKTYPDTAICPF